MQLPKSLLIILGGMLVLLYLLGGLTVGAFPVLLALRTPVPATNVLLGMALALLGSGMLTRSAWQKRGEHPLWRCIRERDGFLWLGCLGGGLVLCLIFVEPPLEAFFAVFSGIIVGLFLFAGALWSLAWFVPPMTATPQREGETSVEQPVPRLGASATLALVAGMCFPVVPGTLLVVFTLNGSVTNAITSLAVSVRPPFGPVSFSVVEGSAILLGGAYGLTHLFRLHARPGLEGIFHLVARVAWGAASICLGSEILIPLPPSFSQMAWPNAMLFGLAIGSAVLGSLLWLAAWIVGEREMQRQSRFTERTY